MIHFFFAALLLTEQTAATVKTLNDRVEGCKDPFVFERLIELRLVVADLNESAAIIAIAVANMMIEGDS